MKIEFDPGKDAINTRKHGVSLADAVLLEWECMWLIEDVRNCYGERRMIGYAPIGSRVYCLVFADRGSIRRVISLRKANRREALCVSLVVA
ncbi:BrnT family toxin [Marinobacter salexigens]|uniref:BrnT family toxin n=1 Tax=Marinobacter salexigens TaxID=1925763 RepID=UPI000C28B91C